MTQQSRRDFIRHMQKVGKNLASSIYPEDTHDGFTLGKLYIFLRYEHDMERLVDALLNHTYKENLCSIGRFVPVPEDGSYPFIWVSSSPEDAINNPFVAFCPIFPEDLHPF